jgi:hypothetical protein
MERRGLPASYDGTLYRSHLEARWAIFFAKLDVKAIYEPQGFDLGDGTAYLPDFAVYGALGTLWIEVKPQWDADSQGIEKWRRFAGMRPKPSESRAALLVGPPSSEAPGHIVIGGDETLFGWPDGTRGVANGDPLKGPWEDGEYAWRPCVGGYHFDLAYAYESNYMTLGDGCPAHAGGDGHQRIYDAACAAMSHRFGKFGPQSGTAA